MGRLIDEDDVMHMLTGIELNNGTFTGAKTELRNVKTAYSVEKVVAELEEEGYLISVNDGSKCIKVDNAISVVERGGLE